MAIGMKIKEARKNAGLSQQKLAEVVGVKQAAVAAWESGRNQPNPDMIKAIAMTCGVSANFLVGMPDNYGKLSDNTQELAEIIAALSPSDRAVIEKVLSAMVANAADQRKNTVP